VELRAVCGVHFIASISRAGRNHADRRRRILHGADLHGRGVGAEKPAVRQIKGVLLVARGVIGRGVEGVEAMPFGFHVRTFGERKAHPPENADPAIEHLGEGMQAAQLGGDAGKRDVDVLELACLPRGAKALGGLLDCGRDGAARFVQEFADNRALFLAERFHPIGPRRDAAGAAKVANAGRVERLLVGRGGDFSQRRVAELFQLVRHENER
jgi:hypothetical protein